MVDYLLVIKTYNIASFFLIFIPYSTSLYAVGYQKGQNKKGRTRPPFIQLFIPPVNLRI